MCFQVKLNKNSISFRRRRGKKRIALHRWCYSVCRNVFCGTVSVLYARRLKSKQFIVKKRVAANICFLSKRSHSIVLLRIHLIYCNLTLYHPSTHQQGGYTTKWTGAQPDPPPLWGTLPQPRENRKYTSAKTHIDMHTQIVTAKQWYKITWLQNCREQVTQYCTNT